MTINLYSTADDPRKVTKTLTAIATDISCKPAENFNLIAPRVLLDYSSTYAGTNYIYISDFDRYYFAELTLVTGKELMLVCQLDPLMSFDISNIDVLAVRSESAGINYVVDSQLPINPNSVIYVGKDLGASPITNTKQILLITNGGT